MKDEQHGYHNKTTAYNPGVNSGARERQAVAVSYYKTPAMLIMNTVKSG